MDINKIFNSFGSSSNSWGWNPRGFNYEDARTLPTIDENHPRYFIKMFKKLVVNHLGDSKRLINLFGSADASLPVEEIERFGEVMVYGRAYTFIKKIDIEDSYHAKILREESSPSLKEAYSMALQFYEENEEYEKCAVLKKQLDFINLSS